MGGAYRKKSTQGLQLDEIFLEGTQEQAGFWSDDATRARPVTARRDPADFAAARTRPANDAGHGPHPAKRTRQDFAGSPPFWKAMTASAIVVAALTVFLGLSGGEGLGSLLHSPVEFAPFLASLAVIFALPWLFALGAHRQAVGNEMLRRVMLATQRMGDPQEMADLTGQRISLSLDQAFAEIDGRMALLDRQSAQFADRIAAAMHQSAEAADITHAAMLRIADAAETQRDALQRSGMAVSTEVLPILAKLEAGVASLERVSQSAGGILDVIGERLHKSTQDLRSCLDAFNSANHTVTPEIEKRLLKFEASVGQLPEQLDATIGRLGPMSETIADAAILSTANVEVMDQLAKDIAGALDRGRGVFSSLSPATVELFQTSVDAHVAQFRELIGAVVAQQAARVSGLSVELEQLAGTAASVIDKLQQPVGLVTAAADHALANVNDKMMSLDQRIESSLRAHAEEMGEAATRIVSTVNREIENATLSLQTKLAASSTELMQRLNTDTARFEALIGETGDRTTGRITAVLQDLPAVLAQRVETELAGIDGTLKGMVVALNEQMRSALEAVPERLEALTRDTLQTLESSMSHSFGDIAQRAEGLSEQFRRTATETTESVLQSYVDFIYMAVDRFRQEMENANRSLASSLAAPRAADQAPDTPEQQGQVTPQA